MKTLRSSLIPLIYLAWASAAAAQSPLCHYVFDNSGKALDTTGLHEEMRLSKGSRVADYTKGGVRLDESSMSTAPVLLTNAFTVCAWIRPMAFGAKALAQSWPNGMVVNCGSGYFEGWRLILQEKERFRPVFEIGRPKGSVSIAAERGLVPASWQMLTATWTPKASERLGTMRLYINNELVAESTTNVGAPLAPNGPLSIGYTDFGVGNLLMDFAELSIYDSALPAAKIAELFLSGNYSQNLAPPFDRAEWLGIKALAIGKNKPGDAMKNWCSLASDDSSDIIHRLLAATKCNDAPLLSKLLENPQTPAFLKMKYNVKGFAKHACRLGGTQNNELPQKRVYVSSSGLDSGDGSDFAPFASLERARAEVHRLRDNGFKGRIAVILASGTYLCTKPLNLDASDSDVVYAAKPGNAPVILQGGIRNNWSDFKKVADMSTLARIPEEARGKVFVADVHLGDYKLPPQGSYGVGESPRSVMLLSANDTALLNSARWPNQGFLTSTNRINAEANTIGIETNRAARWKSAGSLMAHGYWMYTWADAALPISIQGTNGNWSLKLSKPHTYGIGKTPHFFVFNLLEELDEPDEWFFDSATSRLYLIPPEGTPPDYVTLTALAEPFITISGANNVEFRGLSFRNARGDAVRVRQSQNAVFSGCDFRCIGGTALDATGCPGLIVRDSSFRNLGHGGIIADAGNRRTLESGNVQIHNNKFSKVGQSARTYTPGVLLQGVGGIICHNEFFDMPSSAMRIEGNDHIIELNDIHEAVLESDDQGAVDMWGDPSYRRCIFRYNTFRNIGNPAGAPCGQGAIRFDDMISGMIVHDNTFINASRPNFGAVQIHGGSQNIICSNTIRDCDIGISFSPWGADRWNLQLTNNQEVIRKITTDVDIQTPPYTTRYPEIKDIRQDVDRNFIWDNTMIKCGKPYHNLPKQTQTIWNTLEK